MVFHFRATRSFTDSCEAETLREAVQKFAEAHPGYRIESIDATGFGGRVVGMCEECKMPIVEGETHVTYADGVLVCSRH